MTRMTGKRRIMPIVLGISLALNLAVLAAAGGAAWRFYGADDKGHGRMGKGGPIYMQALPAGERQRLRAQLRDMARGTRSIAPMIDALRAVPFHADAVASALAQQVEAGRARQAVASAALLERITQMDDAARAAYAARLEEISAQRAARSSR